MQNTNESTQRDLLQQMPTARLAQLMRHEIRKPEPDMKLIKEILSILDEREARKNPAETDSRAEEAWNRYQQRIEASQKKAKPARHPRMISWLATAAALIILFAIVVPQRVEADRFWDFLTQWKDSVLEFHSSSDRFRNQEQEFKTDHPAMQAIYDQAISQGIKNPLIPMWFEEEYVWNGSEKTSNTSVDSISISLLYEEKKAIFVIDSYKTETYHGYCRNDTFQESFEQEGVKFGLTENNGKWVAVWSKDNIEYFLTIDCQEDTLRRILKSIFVTEEYL